MSKSVQRRLTIQKRGHCVACGAIVPEKQESPFPGHLANCSLVKSWVPAEDPSPSEWQLAKCGYALQALVEQLDRVHADPVYQSVWTLSQIHNGSYRGPTYTRELEYARQALTAALPPAPKEKL